MPRFKAVQHTGNKPNLERRDRVKTMYLAGMSIREIAEAVNTTHQAVHGLLERMGIPRRPRGGNTGSHSRHRK